MLSWANWISISLLLIIISTGYVFAEPRATHGKFGEERAAVDSSWLKKVQKPRVTGCWNQPWICHDSGKADHNQLLPFNKKMCCKNRCVDVSSDVNNCGLCGIRCPFSWQCCKGLCIDTNINPFHCGNCWNKCPFGSLCFYGMCGYALPLPPFPFPFPPKHPKPPFPFPPHFPFPPKPPKTNPPPVIS